MKKFYETAEVTVFLFERPDVIVASAAEDTTTVATTADSDETEIL